MTDTIQWRGFRPEKLPSPYGGIVARWAKWEKRITRSRDFVAAQIDEPKPQRISSQHYDKEPVIIISMLNKSGQIIDRAHIDRRCNVTKHADRKARDGRRAARRGRPRPPRRRVQIQKNRPRTRTGTKAAGRRGAPGLGGRRPEPVQARQARPDPRQQALASRPQNTRYMERR
ncbi:hypothetical protein GJ744_003518 [Endocarpon pusillum]|uniref:Uncharacterized protein n=1 Tax=Endocarpon pusillum TaxID=364733 RepID=A0A8H7APE4_9EURO|nr:hypothetical protein GJ744_003518 [Endocarpon pusillum]